MKNVPGHPIFQKPSEQTASFLQAAEPDFTGFFQERKFKMTMYLSGKYLYTRAVNSQVTFAKDIGQGHLIICQARLRFEIQGPPSQLGTYKNNHRQSTSKFQEDIKTKQCGIEFLDGSFDKSWKVRSSDPSAIREWAARLEKHISRLLFHQTFIPLNKLGKGSFATVYLAECKLTGKCFAVKAFSKKVVFADPKVKTSLLNEIEIMRFFDHPNLIGLQCIYQSKNSLYIVMEAVSGGALHDRLVENHIILSEDKTCEIIRGLLEGLVEIGKRNIMHRDLKLENILLRQKCNFMPVIIDFGLAQFCNKSPYMMPRCGTVGFVAPEVCALEQGHGVTPVVDMFSIGVILHILLLGKPVFEGTSIPQVFAKNKQCEINFEMEAYKTLKVESFDLLKKMLQKDPSNRISCEQALKHPFLEGNKK